MFFLGSFMMIVGLGFAYLGFDGVFELGPLKLNFQQRFEKRLTEILDHNTEHKERANIVGILKDPYGFIHSEDWDDITEAIKTNHPDKHENLKGLANWLKRTRGHYSENISVISLADADSIKGRLVYHDNDLLPEPLDFLGQRRLQLCELFYNGSAISLKVLQGVDLSSLNIEPESKLSFTVQIHIDDFVELHCKAYGYAIPEKNSREWTAIRNQGIYYGNFELRFSPEFKPLAQR